MQNQHRRVDIRRKHLSQERPIRNTPSPLPPIQNKHKSQEKDKENTEKETSQVVVAVVTNNDKERTPSPSLKESKHNSQEKNTPKPKETPQNDRKKEPPLTDPKLPHDKIVKITLSPTSRARKYSAPPKPNDKILSTKSSERKDNSPSIKGTSTSTAFNPLIAPTNPSSNTTNTTATAAVNSTTTNLISSALSTSANTTTVVRDYHHSEKEKEKEITYHSKDPKKKVIESASSTSKRNSLEISTRMSKDISLTNSPNAKREREDEDSWKRVLGDHSKGLSTLLETFALLSVTFLTPYSKTKVISIINKGKKLETINESEEKEEDPTDVHF
jgi:hypothetical protein